jgi:hypothetical protein
MKQCETKELFAYWAQVKGGRRAPERFDIDPAAIRPLLGDTFIIQLDGDTEYAIRLSGGRFNALWLQDRKGDSFIELWRRSDRQIVRDALGAVVDEAAPVVAGVRARPLELHLSSIDFEMLLLPLRHLGRTHSRVMGSLAPANGRGWVGFAPAQQLELLSFRTIRIEDEIASVGNLEAIGRRPAQFRPKLIVYDGGKTSSS